MKRLGIAQRVGASMTFCTLQVNTKPVTNVEREHGNIELTKTSMAMNTIHEHLYLKSVHMMEGIMNAEESNTSKVPFINIFKKYGKVKQTMNELR